MRLADFTMACIAIDCYPGRIYFNVYKEKSAEKSNLHVPFLSPIARGFCSVRLTPTDAALKQICFVTYQSLYACTMDGFLCTTITSKLLKFTREHDDSWDNRDYFEQRCGRNIWHCFDQQGDCIVSSKQ